jgi:hypothetical protein
MCPSNFSIPIPPIGCLMLGIVLLFLSAFELFVAVFRRGMVRHYPWLHGRWGRGRHGPPISRIGAMAWGISIGVCGVISILGGFFSAMSKISVFLSFLASLLVLGLANIYDSQRQRRNPAK